MNSKPNILLIMTDQQRYDSLGCYGFKGIATPNLDRLASEGVLFENCYVNNPICTPSRASIFTGKHLPGHGVYRLNDMLPKDEVMFTKRLQDVGYQTALIGKLHISAAMFELENRNENDGFDIYDWCHEPAIFLDGKYNAYGKWLKKNYLAFYKKLKEEGRELGNVPAEMHATKWTADRTIEHIKSRDKDKPFCYVMSIFDPHNPYSDYPIDMEKRINKKEIEKAKYTDGESHYNKPLGITREHEHSYMGGFHDYSDGDIDKMRKGYYASIAFIDEQVGNVLDELEKQELKDDTIVIFVSDHGDMLGDHELLSKGAFFYDACTKVPFIMRYPQKLQVCQRNKALVQPHDIAATILAQSGFTQNDLDEIVPESIDLIALINSDKNEKEREYAFCMYRGTGICDTKEYFDPPINATMIRDEHYKLNVYHDISDANGDSCGELYDMADDPDEKCNLWNDSKHIDAKLDLLGKLMNWMVKTDIKNNCSKGGQSRTISKSLLCK